MLILIECKFLHVVSDCIVNFCVCLYLTLQYLKYRGLEKSVSAFESECFEKGTPVASTEITPKASRQLSAVQVCLISLVSSDAEITLQIQFPANSI